MADAVRAAHDLSALVGTPPAGGGTRISEMVASLSGSEILRIAGEIRALVAAGQARLRPHRGRLRPAAVPDPARAQGRHRGGARARRDELSALERRARAARGGPALLRARARASSTRSSRSSSPGGSRPVIYATYRTLVDPGDRVRLPGAELEQQPLRPPRGRRWPCPSAAGPRSRFLPAPRRRAPAAAGRAAPLPSTRRSTRRAPRSPPTPCARICELVLEENARRERARRAPAVPDVRPGLLDAVLRRHRARDARRRCVPEMAPYTVFVDGISKAFAATGLRVGWAVGPVDVIARMSALLGHVGAWAPRAEQVATAELLDDPRPSAPSMPASCRAVQARLDRLHRGLQALARGRLRRSTACRRWARST